ncbi:hypothetical protein BFN01_04495 [Microbacterium sp. AR7-10]|nr:hypothetical protein BFN01_04495 [Microbacterium sp. AR7-10]
MADVSSPALDGMYPVGQRPALGPYLVEAWRRRRFAMTLAGHRLIGGLLQNRLGILWLVLRPLSLALIYGTMFSFVLSDAARPSGYAQYIIVGICIFEFFAQSISGGAKSITSNSKLVQSLGFPRILLPISIVIEETMKMIPVIALTFIILFVFGEPPAWSWLLLFPLVAVMAVFNLGCALIAARMSVWARDVQQLIPIMNRVLLYATGIFFDVDGALADHPLLLNIVHVIPTYGFVGVARDVLIDSYSAPAIAWVLAPAWAIVTIAVGVIFFWRAEARYGVVE